MVLSTIPVLSTPGGVHDTPPAAEVTSQQCMLTSSTAYVHTEAVMHATSPDTRARRVAAAR
jgi:hypothetical protein